ncbi:MAG: class I SAM-dependent methyltransferase [Candidatus Krumholzibacteria bacterium]|nr:class I SAM-dependent methyltransferase [Candidatus Krumholzibacteria bacterium]
MEAITVTEHDRTYWQYEYAAAARYLIPLLRAWGVARAGLRVLDVGCGDGGGLSAMHDAGFLCQGFDIGPRRIAIGHALRGGRAIELSVGDIFCAGAPFCNDRFDLVVLRDVFEHLEHKPEALATLRRLLAPGGAIMISFPPYYSPFGAHQQLLRAKIGRVPYVHLVPGALERLLPRLRGEHPPFVEEVRKLNDMRMGISRFERFAREADLAVTRKKFYLISPGHIRFGLRPCSAGLLGRIPLLRELLVTGVVYLLKDAEPQT